MKHVYMELHETCAQGYQICDMRHVYRVNRYVTRDVYRVVRYVT